MSELFSVFGSAAKPPSQKQKKRVAKAGNCSLKNLQIQFDGVKKLQIKSILLFDANQNDFKKLCYEKALSRSAIRSSASSIPTLKRTRSSVIPNSARFSAGMEAWVIKAG